MASDTRAPLSAERIVAAALSIVDDGGLDGLTMRRLGDALGFEAMAIYRHLSSRDAVLDAVVAHLYDEMTPPDPTASWRDCLRHIAAELRRCGIAHPHLFQRVVTQPPAHPAVSRRIDSALSAIRTLRDDEAFVAQQFWLFLSYTTGALLGETTALIGPNGLDGALSATLDANEVLAAQCPALAEFGPALAACDFAVDYERGVETILDAMAAAADAASK